MKTPFRQRKKRLAFTRIVKWHIREVHPVGSQTEKIRIVIQLGPYNRNYMNVNEKMWHRHMHNYVTSHLGFRHLKDVKAGHDVTYLKLYERILPLDITTWRTIESILLAYKEDEPETALVKECFAVLNKAFSPEPELLGTESGSDSEFTKTALYA